MRSLLLILLLLPTALFANEGAEGPSFISQMLMIGFFMGMFYLLILRPQNKKTQEHNKMLAKLTTGDEVVTSGGLVGKITAVRDLYFIVELANNIKVTLKKDAVSNVLPKGTCKSIA